MKKTLSLLLFVLMYTNVYSQNQKPSDLEIYNLYVAKADSLITNKNYEQAIEYLNKGLKLKVDNQTILFKRGIAYFGLKENRKAIADFTGIIINDDKNAQAYYFRALAKFNLETQNSKPDPENTTSACEDLYSSKNFGYPIDFENYREICPDL